MVGILYKLFITLIFKEISASYLLNGYNLIPLDKLGPDTSITLTDDEYMAPNFTDASLRLPLKDVISDEELVPPFIIETEFKFDEVTDTCLIQFSQKGDTPYFSLCIEPSNQSVRRFVFNGVEDSDTSFLQSFDAGSWLKYSFVVNRYSIKLLQDCVEVSGLQLDLGNNIYIEPGALLIVGENQENEQNFNGAIRKLKIYPNSTYETIDNICEKFNDDQTDPDVANIEQPAMKGEKGDKGDKGDVGEKGYQGIPGPPGRSVMGPEGPVGPEGPIGQPGPEGKQGPKGECECSPNTVSALLQSMSEMRGPRGPEGPRGPPGFDGSKGERGRDGPPGNPGADGKNGEQGLKGEAGQDGRPGQHGQPGRDGERGPTGERGPVGPAGPPGPGYMESEDDRKARQIRIPGPKGDQGPPGLPGDRGPRGDTGERGDPGDIGLKGDKGEKGLKGEIGDVGKKGDKGEAGIDGTPGMHGRNGFDGRMGLKGDKGAPGLAGLPASIASILDENIDPVIEAAIIEKFKGPRGDHGEKGPKGDKGELGFPGRPGRPGTPGKNGAPGQRGLVGISGKKGSSGAVGPKGPKGEPGPAGTVPASQIPLMKGPPGALGPKGNTGEKGEKGERAPEVDISKLKGEKGDRGIPGVSGPVGPMGPIGPSGAPGTCNDTCLKNQPLNLASPGHRGPPGPPGPPGAPGRAGRDGKPGSHGVSIEGPRGEPGILREIVKVDPDDKIQYEIHDDDEGFFKSYTVIFKTYKGLLKRASKIPEGTLAYVLQDRLLLLRVGNIWERINFGAPPQNEPTVKTTPRPNHTHKPLHLHSIPKGTIRLAALNKPYSGKMPATHTDGLRGVDDECYRQANSFGYNSTFVAVLSIGITDLTTIVSPADRHLPVTNLHGKVVFPSWKSIFTEDYSSRGKPQANIYSFDNKNIFVDANWPNREVWLGADEHGNRSVKAFCNEWTSDSKDVFGIASPVNKLLEQRIMSCDKELIVLCVEKTSHDSRYKKQSKRRARHSKRKQRSLILHNT